MCLDGYVKSLLPLTAFTLVSASNAAVLVPDEYSAIQDAINASDSGDTVLVAPGVYTGPGNQSIDTDGKNILLKSLGGAHVTILDSEGRPGDNVRVLQVVSGEDSTCVIDGFTMRGGYYTSQFGHGAGILIVASPTIRGCITEENYSAGGGAGVSTIGTARPKLEGCWIRNNESVSGGGGVRGVDTSHAVLMGCAIEANSVDGINVYESASLTVVGSRVQANAMTGVDTSSNGRVACIDTQISGNLGTGVFIGNSETVIRGCTITGNNGGPWPGGIYWWGAGDGSTLLVERTILWGNCSNSDPEGAFDDAPTFRCCVVDTLAFNDPIDFDGPQVSEDPQFCAAPECGDAPTAEGDLSLQPTSPALPGNNPCGVLIGALGGGCVVKDATGWPSLETTVRVSPNPVHGNASFVELQGVPEGDVAVEIFDASGKRVGGTKADWGFRGSARVVFARPLASGVYFARVRGVTQSTDVRFVVLQ